MLQTLFLFVDLQLIVLCWSGKSIINKINTINIITILQPSNFNVFLHGYFLQCRFIIFIIKLLTKPFENYSVISYNKKLVIIIDAIKDFNWSNFFRTERVKGGIDKTFAHKDNLLRIRKPILEIGKCTTNQQGDPLILMLLEASQPKWVNPIFNIIGVNSLSLGGLQL